LSVRRGAAYHSRGNSVIRGRNKLYVRREKETSPRMADLKRRSASIGAQKNIQTKGKRSRKGYLLKMNATDCGVIETNGPHKQGDRAVILIPERSKKGGEGSMRGMYHPG